MTTSLSAYPVGPRTLLLGEGPRWAGDRFLLVDILNGLLLELRPGEAEPTTLIDLGEVPLGAVAPTTSGRFIAAAGTGIALLDPTSGTGATADSSPAATVTWLARPEDDAPTPMRMNDGVADSKGRFWAGSMAYDNTAGAGSLFRVDPDGSVHTVLRDLTIPNGPAVNATADTMYLADSARGIVFRIWIDEAGNLGTPEVFLSADTFGDASPDGMAFDTLGNLWIGLWGGAQVRCYSPAGELLRTIEVGAHQVTAPCFGGPGLDSLLITTAAVGASPEDTLAGRLFAIDVDAQGTPAAVFDDSALWTGPAPRVSPAS